MDKFFTMRFTFYSLLIFLGSFSSVTAQVSTASPYSRYGVGDIQFSGFSKNLGMGGTAFAVSTPFSINFQNPASYAYLALTTFEAAAVANFDQVKNSTASGYFDKVAFGYFSMAFPLKTNKAGLSLGLLPYSNVGYDIETSGTNLDTNIIQSKYQGNGGLNQFYVGAGWSPFNNLSVGANVSFMFGTMSRIARVEYPYNYYVNTKYSESTVINDFYFSFGILKTFDSLTVAKSDSLVMLDKERLKLNDSMKVLEKRIQSPEIKSGPLENLSSLSAAITALKAKLIINDTLRKHVVVRNQRSNWSFSLGATLSPSRRLRGSNTLFEETYVINLAQEVAKDTIVNTEDKNGKLVLPLSVGTGLCIKQGTRWMIASDFSFQNWKDYSLFGEKDSLANSWRATAGLQFVPNDRSNKSYFNLIQYRLGFHYEQTFLQLHNTQLNDAGISLGFGFPMRRTATTIQASVEAGRRGTVSNNLIELNYVKCTLAFTINDRWFIKQKFD